MSFVAGTFISKRQRFPAVPQTTWIPGAEIFDVELSPFPVGKAISFPSAGNRTSTYSAGFHSPSRRNPNVPVTAWNRFTSNGMRDPLRRGGDHLQDLPERILDRNVLVRDGDLVLVVRTKGRQEQLPRPSVRPISWLLWYTRTPSRPPDADEPEAVRNRAAEPDRLPDDGDPPIRGEPDEAASSTSVDPLAPVLRRVGAEPGVVLHGRVHRRWRKAPLSPSARPRHRTPNPLPRAGSSGPAPSPSGRRPPPGNSRRETGRVPGSSSPPA